MKFNSGQEMIRMGMQAITTIFGGHFDEKNLRSYTGRNAAGRNDRLFGRQ